MVSGAEFLGLVAGFLIAFSYIPQVLRVWKLKDASQISLAFNLLTLSGTVLWLGYGLLLNLLAVTLWNGVNAALVSWLLVVKLRYGMGRGPPGKILTSGQ